MSGEPKIMLLESIHDLMLKSAIGGILKGQSGVIPDTPEAVTEAACEVVSAVMLVERQNKNDSKNKRVRNTGRE